MVTDFWFNTIKIELNEIAEIISLYRIVTVGFYNLFGKFAIPIFGSSIGEVREDFCFWFGRNI